MKRAFIVLLLVLVFGGGGGWIEWHRYRQHSALSGFFENQPTDVSARIPGRVAKIDVAEGQAVKAGQLLVELEARPTQRETTASGQTAEQAREAFLEISHGPRAQDIRRQEAVVAELAATLRKLRNGSRPEEIQQARAAEREAHARLQQAERGLTREERGELKARLDAARVEEKVARDDAVRYTELYHQDEVSRQQYERKRADADRAAAQRRDAEQAWLRARRGTPKEELEQARQSWLQSQAALDLALHGSRAEDIEAAAARLLQAQEQLDELRSGNRPEQIAQARAAARAAQESAQSAHIRTQERMVDSPMDGIVERVPVAVGDLVSSGVPLVRMVDPHDIWIRVYVPEAHLAQAAPATAAELQVDGIAERLRAHVESVATQGEFTPINLQSPEERGKQVFATRLRLDQPDGRIRAGMFATVKRLGQWSP